MKTYLDRAKELHPDMTEEGIARGCPSEHGLEDMQPMGYCATITCEKCWNRTYRR